MSAVPKFADKKSLKNLVPLNGLSATHFEELAKKATVLELKPGKYLFKKGERDSSTCYVLSGEIALVDGSDIKLTIEGGTEEAKHPIAQQQPRQLGARAKTHCTVISIDSGLLDVMLAWEQSTAYEVDDIESDDEDWMTRMMQSDLLQRLPATNLQQLFMRMQEVEVSAGEVVFNQDEEGDYYYIIKQGKCVVSRKASAKGRAIKLAELKDGDSFGEESLLSGAKRNASITMLTPGKLMRLAKDDFNELLKAPLLSQVDFEEAKALVSEGAVYLDVRLPGEFNNAHFKDSINIPLAAIRSDMVNIDRNKEYIVYCDTGRRSTSAVFLLGQFGIEAHVLKDGLSNVPIDAYKTSQSKAAESAEIIDINRDKEAKAGAPVDTAELEQIAKEKAQFEENIAQLKSELKDLKQKLTNTEKNITKNEKAAAKANDLFNQEQEKVKSLEDELQALRDVEIESDKLKGKLEKAIADVEEQNKLYENARQSDECAQQKMLSQQEELDALKKQLEEAQSNLSERESSSDVKHKELEAANRKLNALSAERDELAEKIASQDEEKTALVDELEGNNKKLASEMAALQTLVTELKSSKAEVEKSHEQDKSQLVAIQNDLSSSENEKNELLVQLNALQETYSKEQQQLEQVAKQKKSLEEELQALKSSFETGQSESQEQANTLQKTIKSYQGERDDLDKKLQDSNARIQDLESEIVQLQEAGEQSESNSAQLIEELNEQIQAVNKEAQAYKQEIATLTASLSDVEGKLIELQGSSKTSQDEARQQIEQLESHLAIAKKDVEEKESLYEEKAKGYQENEAELNQRLSDLENELLQHKEKLAAEKETSDQQLLERQQRIEQLTLDIEKLAQDGSASEAQMQEQLKEAEDVRQQLKEEVDSLVVKINEGKELLLQQKAGSDQELQQSQEKIIAFEANIESLEFSNLELRQTIQELESSVQKYTQELESSQGDKQALEAKLKESSDELDNIRNVLANANLNKDDLESRYQQQYEQFKTDREDLEEKLRHTQNKLDELANLNKQLQSGQSESHEVASQLSAANLELENLKTDLSQAQLEKQELESQHQQQYESLQKEREQIEEQLRQSQDSVDKLSGLNKQLESGQSNSDELAGQLDAANVELSDLRNALSQANLEKNEALSLHQQHSDEFLTVRNKLEEQLRQAQEKLDALTKINEGLEAAKASEADDGELDELRLSLDDAQKKCDASENLLAEKTREEETTKNELIALRAVYVQKEADVERLQDELEQAKQTQANAGDQDNVPNEDFLALEQELKLVRDRYEQVEKESSEMIASLESRVKEKEQVLDGYDTQLDEAKTLKSDAESAFTVMESEVEKLRGDQERYQANIAESHKKIEVLQFELEAMRAERENNQDPQETEALQHELEINKAKLGDLESELQQDRHELKLAKEKIETQAASLQDHREQSNKEVGMQSQLEQLKLEMKTQMDVYKAEVENNTSKLSMENEKLQKEIENLNKQKENAAAETVLAGTEADHSALFDLPDIDKNAFAANADRAKPKSNMLGGIMLALILSALSAGGVYWYFVMGAQQQGGANTSASRKVTPEAGAASKPVAKTANKLKTDTKSVKKAIKGKLKPSRVFADFIAAGGKGPVMVGVPAGIFSMGSPSNSTHFEERPQHTVSLRKFSISKNEVSFADYDRFAEATERALPSDNGWGRGNRPVVNVSWDDAVAYTEWLSEQTGHQYRLPSEAEWEYAARAGTQDKYWWGAALEHNRANCFNCGSQWDRTSTAPTGSFAASSLGLHDMTGNVMEWVSDCYHSSYDGAPIDGSAWMDNSCKARVVRGGSYRSTADNIRVTKRSEFSQDSAVDHIGFRIVRSR